MAPTSVVQEVGMSLRG